MSDLPRWCWRCPTNGYHDPANCPTHAPAPSPYRFTVSVERRPGSVEGKWRTHIKEDGRPFAVMSAHDTEAEARSHAAQVLAALHQAVLE